MDDEPFDFRPAIHLCPPDDSPPASDPPPVIFVIHIFRGVRHVSTIRDTYPEHFPATWARRHLQAIKETVANKATHWRPAKMHHVRREIHNLEAAINVGVHAINPTLLDRIADALGDFRQPEDRGLLARAAQGIAFGNDHAADFLIGAHPARYAPDVPVETARQLIRTATTLGIHQSQLPGLARALGHLPSELDLSLPDQPLKQPAIHAYAGSLTSENAHRPAVPGPELNRWLHGHGIRTPDSWDHTRNLTAAVRSALALPDEPTPRMVRSSRSLHHGKRSYG